MKTYTVLCNDMHGHDRFFAKGLSEEQANMIIQHLKNYFGSIAWKEED